MELTGIFSDFTADGYPLVVIYDEEDNPVCEFIVPVTFIQKLSLEIGSGFIIQPEECGISFKE